MAASLLFAGAAAVGSPVACDSPDALVADGISAHKTCLAGRYPAFGDYEYRYLECRLLLYVTGLPAPPALVEELGGAYAQHAARFPPAACAGRGRPALEVRRATHAYAEFRAWLGAAEAGLTALQPARHASVAYRGRLLEVVVGADADIARVVHAFAALGIPDDAWTIRSDEPAAPP